jgi:hypothetical protein
MDNLESAIGYIVLPAESWKIIKITVDNFLEYIIIKVLNNNKIK